MTQIISIILLLSLPLFTSHTTSRRILHQPFFPATDPPPPPPPPQTTIEPPSPSPSPLPKQPFSSITPTTQTHHHHPFFFPLSTTPPTTTTTVPSTTLPTFPANISSITLPSPQPPSKSHVSKKLLFLSLSLSLLSILFISTMVATFLYHRSRHHKPQDDNHLLPPNHPTSDKPGPPPSLPPNSSTPSTEFLYLGTLFSPMHSHANTTSDFMGSPELHPLPPLVRKVHGNVEEGFKEKVVVAAPPPPAAVAAGGGGGSGVKLKGLHWDKVRGSSDKAMVWDQFKFRSSFRVNEEMMETLFTKAQSSSVLEKKHPSK